MNSIFPSTQVDTILPEFIRSQYPRFVNFISKCKESDERMGFSQDILQNLISYKNLDVYLNGIVTESYLNTNLNVDDETIELTNGFGFPEENGIVYINDEIILYRLRDGNVLSGLKRGSSATVKLATLTSAPEYRSTTAQFHSSGDEVKNISALFFIGILANIQKTYTPGFDINSVFPQIDKKNLVSNIKQFFSSKGSKLGVISLFKILFGELDVDVSYPGDLITYISESTWDKNLICKVVPLPNTFYNSKDRIVDPSSLTGCNFKLKSFNDSVEYSSGSIEYSTRYPSSSVNQYDLVINDNNYNGNLFDNPITTLVRNVNLIGTSEDYRDVTTITVDSTLRFPESGIIFINNEAILYTSKSFNQFLNCTRGYLGVEAEHLAGDIVYGPYYLEGELITKNANGDFITSISKSWPVSLISKVDIIDPGLLHLPGDSVEIGDPGKLDPKDPVVNYWDENAAYQLAGQLFTPAESIEIPVRGDVRGITCGISGVYFDDDYVYIEGSGMPEYEIGPWSIDDSIGSRLLAEPRITIFPKRNKILTNRRKVKKNSGPIGSFIDGTTIISNNSYNKISSGEIVKFNILSPGSEYVNPTVVLVPDTASAEANVVNGSIISIDIIENGQYSEPPEVIITSGDGGEIELSFDQFGRIVAASIVNGGQYYNDVPEISVIDATDRGRGAKLSCSVSGGQIVSVSIDTAGIDYKPSATYVKISPIGSGAVIESEIFTYTEDLVYTITNDTNFNFDSGNGFVFADEEGEHNRYGICVDPIHIRDVTNDDGTTHSKIVGWAFDGNPIYGPYGFVNNRDDTDGIVKQESYYTLAPTRPGEFPPSESTYPLGFFVEDYVENIAITGLLNTLDKYNGKVCNTPEFPLELYPNGVYCYFITIDSAGEPTFPYVIGNEFYSVPLNQDTTEEQFNSRDILRRNNPSLFNNNEKIEIEIADTSTGSISEVLVSKDDCLVSAGDLVYFDSNGRPGTGAEAIVREVSGSHINRVEYCEITSTVISHRQRIDLSSNPDSGDYVFIPGQFIESFGTANPSKGIVYSWNNLTKVLIVQTISKNLFKGGDNFFDLRYDKRYSSRILAGFPAPAPPYVPAALSVYEETTNVTPSISPSIRGSDPNSVIISTISPVVRYDGSPLIVGDLWWSNYSGRLYVYYISENNITTWVQTSPYGAISGDYGDTGSVGGNDQDPYVPNSTPVENGRVYISNSAPSSRPDNTPLRVGDLWWSSLNGNMYIWTGPGITVGGIVPCNVCGSTFTDQTSSYWVITDPSSIRSSENASDEIYILPGDPEVIEASGNIGVVVSPDAPLLPETGDLWFSSSSGKMYIYYYDVWAVVNPTAMVTSRYSITYDGTMGPQDLAPGQVPNEVDGFYSSISPIAELEDTEEIFLQSLNHFDEGDILKIGDLVSGYELVRVRRKNKNQSRNSLILERGIPDPAVGPESTSRQIVDGSIIRNTSKYILTVHTDEPHRLRVGDYVRFDSEINQLNQEYRVVIAGHLDVASGVASISSGQISSIAITDPGSNYERNIQFQVDITGGSGVGAYAIAQTNSDGIVSGVYIVNGGFGYEDTDVITLGFLDACSNRSFSIYTPFRYNISTNPTYVTNSSSVEGYARTIRLISGGIGYDALPLARGFIRKEIDRASVRFNMDGTSIDSVDVVNQGNRYYSPNYHILTPNNLGSGAELQINTDDGVVTSIDVLNSGVDYVDPEIIIYEESSLLLITENIGKITSFGVKSPGKWIKADRTQIPNISVPFKVVVKYPPDRTPDAGDWGIGDVVYQGSPEYYDSGERRYEAFARVLSWDPDTCILELRDHFGKFVVGRNLLKESAVDVIVDTGALIVMSGQSEQRAILTGAVSTDGKFITEKSHISSDSSYIQDGFFYQKFSYVIESSKQRNQYKNYVNEITHPTGFVYFSRLSVTDIVSSQSSVEDADVQII